jgi:hypothetical protein
MVSDSGGGPWLCHVCDVKSVGESRTCAACYKTTCDKHLRHVTAYNPKSGLYELQPICLNCAIDSAQ